MLKRVLPYFLMPIAVAMLALMVQQMIQQQASAQAGGCQTFKETQKTVCGKFLIYWQQHGGLAQQGYPISSEFTEKSDLNGKDYTVQYFERAEFELHPEFAAPNDVLLSQLGTFQFKRKYPNGEPTGRDLTTPTPVKQGQLLMGTGVTDNYFPVSLKTGTVLFRSISSGGAMTVNLTDNSKKIITKLAETIGSSEVLSTVNVQADSNFLVHVQYNGIGDWSVSIEGAHTNGP